MKKTLLLASLTLLALSLQGCNIISKQANHLFADDIDSTLSWKNTSFKQTKEIKQDGEVVANHIVDFQVTYPTNKDLTVADSIRAWILSHFDCKESIEPQDFPAAIDRFGKKTLEGFMLEIQEDYDPEEGYTLCSGRGKETQISVAYEDNQYVTLILSGDIYLGGAHGLPCYFGATFRKSDGHKMGWELLSDMSTSQIQTAIKKGLMEYFNITDINELSKYLFLENEETFNNAFPLPEQEPYLTKEGVEVTYAPYEIACFAAGMPSAIVKKN